MVNVHFVLSLLLGLFGTYLHWIFFNDHNFQQIPSKYWKRTKNIHIHMFLGFFIGLVEALAFLNMSGKLSCVIEL